MKTLQKLSKNQLDFFDTFGYLAFPEMLRDCIDKIILRCFHRSHDQMIMEAHHLV